MDQTAINRIRENVGRLLERGDRETVRIAIEQMSRLLLEGPDAESGGPVGADADIFNSAMKFAIRKYRDRSGIGLTIATEVCAMQRQMFVREVNELCSGTLTLDQQEEVAARFQIVLSYWLRTTADQLQHEYEARQVEQDDDLHAPNGSPS